MLSSSVVTNPRVPRLIRHSLNLESGLNDGLALPPVLALVAALQVEGGDFVVVALRAPGRDARLRLRRRDRAPGVGRAAARGRLAEPIPAHQKALYALGVAFLTYGVTTLPPHGNGFIAVYVCAITLGIRRPDIRGYVEARADDIVEIVKLGIFVVFGSLLTVEGLFLDGWAAVAIVRRHAARRAARRAGDRADRDAASSRAALAFMAWFGPKGVATMTFSLLVLGSGIARGERIFDIAALVVLCSIVAHGLSDTPGSEWMARHADGEGGDESRSSSGSAKGAIVRPSTSAKP